MKSVTLIAAFTLVFVLCGCGKRIETTPVTTAADVFRDDCNSFAPAVPGFAPLCDSLPKEKTPEQLAIYDQTIKTLIADLKKWGPDVAKGLIAKCAKLAVNKTSSPLDLQFCLETSHLNVQSLADGSSDPNGYAPLVGKVQEESPSHPRTWSSLTEEERITLRRSAVEACATQASGYVGATCAAVAVHEELFASKKFGDGGEGAKAFKKAMEIYRYADAPHAMAKQALQKIGIPQSVLNSPDAVNAAATRVIADTAKTTEKGIQETKKTVNRLLGHSYL